MNHSFEDLHKLSNLRGKLNDLYFNLAIRLVSFSIVSLFLPMYLFAVGWTLSGIVWFFVMFFSFMALGALFSVSLAKQFGLKNSIALSVVLSVLFFFMMYRLGQGIWVSPVVIAFIGGVSEAIYFVSLNVDFALNSDKAHKRENISALDSFFKSSALFSPVVGAWIIVSWGFELLFAVVIVGLFVALIGALELKGFREKFSFSLSDFFSKKNVRHGVLFLAYGALSVGEWFVWPVFVYLVTYDYYVLALAVAFQALGTGLFVGLFRRAAFGYSFRSFARVGALVYSISWVLRWFASAEIEIYALSLLSGIALVLVNVPLFNDTFERAKEKGVVGFIGFREVAVCLGRVALLLVVACALAYGVSWSVAAFFGLALSSLVFLWFE